ncbi:hypothetical protein SDC9_96488 [bioreactor metagenome]|uniref:Uncharacterized protein n=1 Tax=bioreactor metagenome TaxID=1076179 RepID=A0A645A9U1_9ZZZZ
MPGEAHHANTLGRHVYRQQPRRLGCVQNKRQTVGSAKISHPGKIRDVAGEVGGMSTYHTLGVGPQQFFKIRVINLPLPVSGDEIHFSALRPQSVQRSEDGVVLPVRGNHVVAGSEQARNGRVQRLRGVLGKAYPFRPFAAKQRSQLFSGVVNRPCSGQSFVVGAPTAVAKALQRSQNGLSHCGRLGPGGSGVIQIDHGLITFPALASVSTISYILVTLPTAS